MQIRRRGHLLTLEQWLIRLDSLPKDLIYCAWIRLFKGMRLALRDEGVNGLDERRAGNG